jgi:hypothetical protein
VVLRKLFGSKVGLCGTACLAAFCGLLQAAVIKETYASATLVSCVHLQACYPGYDQQQFMVEHNQHHIFYDTRAGSAAAAVGQAAACSPPELLFLLRDFGLDMGEVSGSQSVSKAVPAFLVDTLDHGRVNCLHNISWYLNSADILWTMLQPGVPCQASACSALVHSVLVLTFLQLTAPAYLEEQLQDLSIDDALDVASICAKNGMRAMIAAHFPAAVRCSCRILAPAGQLMWRRCLTAHSTPAL